MAIILNIETATKVCSVAIARNGKVVSFVEEGGEFNHSEKLTNFIQKAATQANISLQDLDAISISKGPGSYTGLRIGVSTAKGLCFSLDKPLISVNTLEAMAFQTALIIKEKALYCPMIDARRMEVYTAFFDVNNNCIRETAADIIDENSYSELLENNKIYFFGDGAEKCKSQITHPNAIFLDNFECSATYMAQLSEAKFNQKQFEDLAYFEPFYLKDFVGTTPKKLL